jgi:hypothetical protein
VRPEGLGKLIKIVHLLGSRTRDLPNSYLVVGICERMGQFGKPKFRWKENFEIGLKDSVCRLAYTSLGQFP